MIGDYIEFSDRGPDVAGEEQSLGHCQKRKGLRVSGKAFRDACGLSILLIIIAHTIDAR